MDIKHTKQIILEKALQLFAQQGYEAISVAKIAQAVGIKAPSLYKHYKNKQEIFDAIIEEMSQRYIKQMQSMMLDGNSPMKDVNVYNNIDVETLVDIGKALFSFFLHDEFLIQFRRLLTIEQYHNKDLATLYRAQYYEGPLQYQSQMFKMLIEYGTMCKEDPEVMALHFYAPMYLLLMAADTNMMKEEEIMTKVEQHIKQFYKLYTR